MSARNVRVVAVTLAVLLGGCSSPPYESVDEEVAAFSPVVEEVVAAAGGEVVDVRVAQGPCEAARGVSAAIRVTVSVAENDRGQALIAAIEQNGTNTQQSAGGEVSRAQIEGGPVIEIWPFHDDDSRLMFSWATRCYVDGPSWTGPELAVTYVTGLAVFGLPIGVGYLAFVMFGKRRTDVERAAARSAMYRIFGLVVGLVLLTLYLGYT